MKKGVQSTHSRRSKPAYSSHQKTSFKYCEQTHNKRELFEKRVRISAFKFEQIQHSSFLYQLEKILKNPIVGRPIVAGYNWILTPASIFVGHYLKKFSNKFNTILLDSLSLVKILEKEQFSSDCYLFTVDFKSLYTNIPVQHAIELMKELVNEYRNVISNADFVIDLLELVLDNSLLEFHGEYFQQIFGIIMGTNVAPILANLYLAKLEKILKEKNQKRSYDGMANSFQTIH